MLEFALFALPSLIYFLVRGRTRDAAQVLGLRWPNLSGWLYGAALALISIAIAWTATIGVPAAVLHGSGTSGRIVNAWGALAVVLAAAGEELFFRGFLQGIIARHWGASVGIIVQGVAFLLPHLLLLTVSPSLIWLVAGQFVIGLMLGWLRQHTASVAPGVLAHVIANLLAGLLS
ncbi:MAG TPA: CPBP family intramembrane metalloprotease [Propionicimonas sp.]|nr:CPBP family intramembrane metalloprotease [Propionicimonas sp.]